MKKLSVVLLVGVLVIGAFATVASAEDVRQATVFRIVKQEGNEVAVEDDTNARAFLIGSGTDEETEYCNANRSVNVTVKAHMAQWARWSLDANGWEWYIKKPGTYQTDCLKGYLRSNGPVTLYFYGFDDLYTANKGDQIAMSFGWVAVEEGQDDTQEPITWIAAADMKDEVMSVQFTQEDTGYDLCSKGLRWSLWNRIHVDSCDKPGTYSMHGAISLVLNNQQISWIDPDTGDFKDLPLP